jgi:nucleoside-diphosphate-sugar epimerase
MVENSNQTRDQSCLVTGAAGFVGQAIVRRLLADGARVRALVLAGDPSAAELRALGSERLEIVAGDVTDAAAVARVCAGATCVWHTAALVHAWAPWERFRAVNVGGTQNVARAARAAGVQRMVHVSTSDVFGIPDRDEELDETSPFRRWNEPYADTKIEAEQWLWQFHRAEHLPLSVIYPGWVYGPGDKAFFLGLAHAINAGPMLFWRRQVRLPWVYIDNLVDACVLAATHSAAPGRGYLVHDGNDGPTLQDVCGRIADRIGAPRPTRHLPYPLVFSVAWLLERVWRLSSATNPPPLRTVDVKAFGYQWHLSTRRVRTELGWMPRIGAEKGMAVALDSLSALWSARTANDGGA